MTNQVKPSEEFLNALNEFKEKWTDARIFTKPEEFQRQFNGLAVLGEKEGISFDSLLDKFHERRMNCKVCNQEATISRHWRICDTCKDKKEWKEWQDKVRREEDPIERYSNLILGIIPDYEKSYEEAKEETKKDENRNWKRRRSSRETEEQMEVYCENEYCSPKQMIEIRISKVTCRCEAEEIILDRYCKTCNLLERVNEYMMDLFKNASEEGRTIV